MIKVLALIANTVNSMITVLTILLLVRAIMSIIAFENEEGKARSFVYAMTEPVLLPVRNFLMRFETLAALPVDFSIVATAFILLLVSALLPSIY